MTVVGTVGRFYDHASLASSRLGNAAYNKADVNASHWDRIGKRKDDQTRLDKDGYPLRIILSSGASGRIYSP